MNATSRPEGGPPITPPTIQPERRGVVGVTNVKERARDLIVFCDGFDEAARYPGFTRRARAVARDLLDALDQLDAERSARIAIQERAERLQAIVGRRADEACAEAGHE
jgi:hypothetical protein